MTKYFGRRGWNLPERDAIPERDFYQRRQILKALGLAGITYMSGLALGCSPSEDAVRIGTQNNPPGADLYPATRNLQFKLDRPMTAELYAASYNNFYEFSTFKSGVYKKSAALKTHPWTMAIDGLVEKPLILDIAALMKSMPIEERLYRFRCVEAWAMAVPWTGFALRHLIERAKPLSAAKYVRFETFFDPKTAPNQSPSYGPWPYSEGLTMAEALNELTLIATGIYGHPLPKQHGAPMRLVVPWKYGFKSIKSIVKIEFVAKQPKTFWHSNRPREYGFSANVDPSVAHPRWSQATETMIDTGERYATLPYNGYGEWVAGLYEKA